MNNKVKIAIMLSGVFIFGLLIGLLFDMTVPIRPMPHLFRRPPRDFRNKRPLSEKFSGIFRERMLREIDPDKEQREEILMIIKKYEEKFIENNDDHMKNMIILFKEMEKELEPLLNERQKEGLQEKLKRLEDGFRHHSGPRPR